MNGGCGTRCTARTTPRTLKELWAHVRANGLYSEEIDIDDLGHARRLLSDKYEIHDFDLDGIVRIEGPGAAS
jgi:hypothetical protein